MSPIDLFDLQWYISTMCKEQILLIPFTVILVILGGTIYTMIYCRQAIVVFIIMEKSWGISSLMIRDQVIGLVQDCSISSANALEILQSCTKPSMCMLSSYPLSCHGAIHEPSSHGVQDSGGTIDSHSLWCQGECSGESAQWNDDLDWTRKWNLGTLYCKLFGSFVLSRCYDIPQPCF